MNAAELQPFAQRLDEARLSATPIEGLTLAHPELTLEDAYTIMEQGIALRLGRGETRVGLKMGFTSEAKRQQMGLASPILGELTDRMRVPAGGVFRVQGSIHPRIEPEIAFITARELRGAVTREEALAACEGVTLALEIIDSRYRDFKLFSLQNVVADNSSSSHFVLGEKRMDPSSLALDSLEMVFAINGVERHRALSSAISGHPATSVVQLCALLEKRGRSLPAGSIVLAGGATAAEALHAGDEVRLTVTGLGELTVRAS